MNKIQLLKEPGYIYDLLFVFFLKYNTEYCMENFVDKKNEQKDKDFYQQILKDFAPISDDLYVFFHALANGQCFITYSYFTHYKNNFTTEYNFEFLQKELSNHSVVIERLIRFCFHELTNVEVESCLNSHVKLVELIKKSHYSDTEKSRLYEFFADPVSYIQKLQYELMLKEVQLSAYYEKNYSSIFKAYNKLTLDILIEQLKPVKDYSYLKNEIGAFYLSYCLINHNCINAFVLNDACVGLLGIDYLNSIKNIGEKKNLVKLSDFGTALSEESRIHMLDLMLEKGEITCKDMEKVFHFSGSTAYHHLTILMKCGVVKTRYEGKLVLYSINDKYFDIAIEILSRYSNKRKGVKQ